MGLATLLPLHDVTAWADPVTPVSLGKKATESPEAKRNWQVGTAVGLGKDGTTVTGRIVSPQDQRVTPAAPATVRVLPGEEVPCLVEDATDWDNWTRGTASGKAEDEVTYTWSWDTTQNGATGGGFGTGAGRGAATGRAATWTAPAEAGTYTIKCTIDDKWTTGQTGVSTPETGTRNDAPADEQVVQVEVRSKDSWAQLRVYPDANGSPSTTEKYAPIGGKVWGVLLIKLAPQHQVVPAAGGSVVLRVEEVSGLHTDADNHIDIPVPLDNAAHWEESASETTGWAPATHTPLEVNGDTGARYFRYKWAWQTNTETPAGTPATKLLGHNELHSLQTVKFNGASATRVKFQEVVEGVAQEPYESGPTPRTADVKNLVITDVTTSADNPDYFKFNPESADSSQVNPTVTFRIEDEGDPHRYKWEVKIRSTGESTWTLFARGQLNSPGLKTVTLNAENPPAGEVQVDAAGVAKELEDVGPYTFDIVVMEIDINYNPLDTESYRAPEPTIESPQRLHFPEEMPGIVDHNDEPVSGHHFEFTAEETETENKPKVQVNYYLQDDRDASVMRIDLLNPQLERIAWDEELPASVNVPHVEIKLSNFNDEGANIEGTYRAIFMAQDGKQEGYRDHQNRRVIPVNRKEAFKKFFIEDDWMAYSRDSPRPARVGLSPQVRSKLVENAYKAAGWIVVHSWSDDPMAYFLNAKSGHLYDLDREDDIDDAYFDSMVYDDRKINGALNTGYRDKVKARELYSRVRFHFWAYRNKSRFIHVIGAAHHNNDDRSPFNSNDNQNGLSGITDETVKLRYSYIFVKRIEDYCNELNYGRPPKDQIDPIAQTARVTTHELAHAIGGFHHTDPHQHPNAEGKELQAYANNNIKALKFYRLKTVPNPTTRNQFRPDVAGIDSSADIFCQWHVRELKKIRDLDLWEKADD